MTERRIFILVPADTPHGPIKGAYALANALAGLRRVALVTLKPGPGAQADLDPRVERIALHPEGRSLRRWVGAYRSLLRAAGGRAAVASVSMCLSADAVNAWCRADAVVCASVRANLVENYRLDYGMPGVPLAIAHLAALRRFDAITAMTTAMAGQVRRYAARMPTVIGNFVDEPPLERHRRTALSHGPWRFAFVGSLTQRKQPWLLARAVAQLHAQGEPATVDLFGTGPLESRVREEAARLGVADAVRLRGFVAEPFDGIAGADALVLPSLSEGLSRAGLEALHLGVPCVMRRADGNAELITDGENGMLFDRDDDLASAMLAAARAARRATGLRPSLLPVGFRQAACAGRYLDLLERRS